MANLYNGPYLCIMNYLAANSKQQVFHAAADQDGGAGDTS